MKKRFSIVMIAAMLCMCIPVIGPHAYAEEGDPMQEPVYMEGGKKAADNSVRTGDEANLALWMLTAVLAAAAFAIVITIKIRRSRY